jgi:hypothetical protein
MTPNREIAQLMGTRLIEYKDQMTKLEMGDIAPRNLQQILSNVSPDSLAAEHELLMAFRYYTIEREQQIAYGYFRNCSSAEEVELALRFTCSRKIVFTPKNIKGTAIIRKEIENQINDDALHDGVKWRELKIRDKELLEKFRLQWKPGQQQKLDSLEEIDCRNKYADGCMRWCKDKGEDEFREKYGNRIAFEMAKMLEEHRDYWSQNSSECYSDEDLNLIFDFSIYGGNFGLGSLLMAWDWYLKLRISAHESPNREVFYKSTHDEKIINSADSRQRPIQWPHSHPDARQLIESHIRTVIKDDIAADVPKFKRHNKYILEMKSRADDFRIKRRVERISAHREAFVSKVINNYGKAILGLIPESDINHYAEEIVDRRKNEEDVWFAILSKYEFDQNTKSCVYFIRQGSAVKIGITNQLERRFAQIKTSASGLCRIENVIYTHHGRKLERALHLALAPYNSHLEWFVLPLNLEKMLFSAKSLAEIEHILRQIKNNMVSDNTERPLDP